MEGLGTMTTDRGRATQTSRSSAELGVVGADSGAEARRRPRQRDADHNGPAHADADEAQPQTNRPATHSEWASERVSREC